MRRARRQPRVPDPRHRRRRRIAAASACAAIRRTILRACASSPSGAWTPSSPTPSTRSPPTALQARPVRVRSCPAPGSSGGYCALPAPRGFAREAPLDGVEPRVPVRPPASRHRLRAREPVVGRIGDEVVDPVVAPRRLRRIDHAGDVARRAQHERDVAADERRRCDTPSATARYGLRATRARRRGCVMRDRSIGHAAHRERARLAQLVVEIQVAQVVDVHRPRQVGRVAVPVEQVERRRRSRPSGSCRRRSSTRARWRAGSRTRSRARCRARARPDMKLRLARGEELRARRRRRSRRGRRSRASW